MYEVRKNICFGFELPENHFFEQSVPHNFIIDRSYSFLIKHFFVWYSFVLVYYLKLCRLGCPRTHRDPSDFDSGVLVLQACVTILNSQ